MRECFVSRGNLRRMLESPPGMHGTLIDGGGLFPGTGFHSHAVGTVTAVQYEGGMAMGAYSPPCFVLPTHGFSIDISGYTEDDVDGYEPGELQNNQGLAYAWERCLLRLFRHGQTYPGVAYAFVGQVCVSAFLYVDGFQRGECRWRRDGVLRQLYLYGEVDEMYSWHADGALVLDVIAHHAVFAEVEELILPSAVLRYAKVRSLLQELLRLALLDFQQGEGEDMPAVLALKQARPGLRIVVERRRGDSPPTETIIVE
ncbi:hypothetical protein KIV45_20935 [Janthinobacterium lividum]|nr:hypothetical protein KIV45_20935 [Janthinobacterium lividum]